jgi:hypothetical protein
LKRRFLIFYNQSRLMAIRERGKNNISLRPYA